MARSSFGPKVVAIALIAEDRGQMLLYGSRRVIEADLSIQHDEFGSIRGYVSSPTIRIRAECAEMQVHWTEPMAEQPHLTQRGIYLPDMSFRALPAPSEEDR